MILLIVGLIMLLIAALCVHEAGHMLALRTLNGWWPRLRLERARLKVGDLRDYKDLTNRQRFKVYFYGVAWGVVPILAFGALVSLVYFSILIPYLFGSLRDLRNMYRCGK